MNKWLFFFKGKKTIVKIAVTLFFVTGCQFPSSNQERQLASKDILSWTCSMHPQVNLPKPGLCPFCNMDLIPLEQREKPENKLFKEAKKDLLFLSPTSKALAKIKTFTVKKKAISKKINLSGRVMPDASLIKKVSARVGGRLEKMYVSFVGTPVKKGDHLYSIYSPDLIQAQQSLIQSKQLYESAKISDNDSLLKTSETTYHSAKERLRLYGFSKSQIKSLTETLPGSGNLSEKKNSANSINFNNFKESFDIYSDHSGIVLSKKVEEGDYVEVGTLIYETVDLSMIWVIFDVYEQDINWIRYGEKISVKFHAIPGKEYLSRIAYVSPMLNEKSRTLQIRISLPNSNSAIKLGMFAEAVIHAKLAEGELIIDNELANKYISPMHPEIIRDKAGSCPICGTALVKAADLGYAVSSKPIKKKVIPKSAPLITGKRAVVYVEKETEEGFFYELREVVLGVKTGKYYVVEKGINEGENVVSQGAFVIDSARELTAKKSMMQTLSE